MRVLNDGTDNVAVLSSGFAVVAAAASGNEVVKELFMDLKIDELMITALKKQKNETIASIYDAIRVLLTADDNRVVASQVSKISYSLKFQLSYNVGICNSNITFHSYRGRQELKSRTLEVTDIRYDFPEVDDEYKIS